jgi:hypothetical protein
MLVSPTVADKLHGLQIQNLQRNLSMKEGVGFTLYTVQYFLHGMSVSPNPCLLQRLYPPPKLVCHPSVIHKFTKVFTDDHRDTIYYTSTCNCNNTTYIHNGVTKLCSFSPWIINLISPFCVVFPLSA